MSGITRTNSDGFGMGGWANAPGFPGSDALSDFILGQEAEGQRELVQSTDLPTDTRGRDDEFTALGFTFGEPHPHDPLFRPATLPQGWTKAPTDHSMHSVIRDEKGRDRVNVFYKAAFYDRKADMALLRPTYRLDQMLYGDHEPTALPIDDWLSADEARSYLDAEWVRAVESRDLGLTDRVPRVDAMRALLP